MVRSPYERRLVGGYEREFRGVRTVVRTLCTLSKGQFVITTASNGRPISVDPAKLAIVAALPPLAAAKSERHSSPQNF
jgi:hypothetical protein